MGRKSLVLLRFCPIVGQNMGQTLKTLASNRFWWDGIPNRNTVRVTELVCGSSGSKTGTKIFCVRAHKRYVFSADQPSDRIVRRVLWVTVKLLYAVI
jgi:hypothetical protein